jgi:hypothetical protein
MPVQTLRTLPWILGLLLVCITLLTSSGCIGLAVNLLHAIQGNNRPAEYKGLDKSRVAVLVANEGGVNNDENCSRLSTFLQASLGANLKKATLIPQQEIDAWLNRNGWTDVDFVELGRDLKADRVVAVTMFNLKLQDGATLYRGFSDLGVEVYDITNGGKLVYSKQFPEFAFPSVGGTPITDTSAAKFRAAYLNVVARKISGLFHDVEATSEFALDATTNRL